MSKVRRETVVDQGVTLLRTRILDSDLVPGTPITEEAMAAALGMSRPTVREVLKTLAMQGLLTRDPKTRILAVTTLSSAEVQEIYRARRVLELAGVDAAAHASDDELRQLVAAVDEMARAAAAGDTAALVAADTRSHTCTVGFLRSRHLSELHNQLMARLSLAITQVEESDNRDDAELVRRHREYGDLVLARDTAAAKKSLLARLEEAEQLVLISSGVTGPGA
ncbi:GntR family transcriptional regulator [uncultured Modestobacter sp.]|uniref:GntR family transcriptional regulator n=1 Tax=uncultured Modestobacter sp. TaxID=380048 RepID=UPI002601D2D7|nr:GntR family transcriptional regulator [uncultured Modestobacter sp.]